MFNSNRYLLILLFIPGFVYPGGCVSKIQVTTPESCENNNGNGGHAVHLNSRATRISEFGDVIDGEAAGPSEIMTLPRIPLLRPSNPPIKVLRPRIGSQDSLPGGWLDLPRANGTHSLINDYQPLPKIKLSRRSSITFNGDMQRLHLNIALRMAKQYIAALAEEGPSLSPIQQSTALNFIRRKFISPSPPNRFIEIVEIVEEAIMAISMGRLPLDSSALVMALGAAESD